jgi:hypothetical protein
MEVFDRHLNTIVDLINKLLTNGSPLSYLSERFSPNEMVWKLSQLIVIYENHISSDSQLINDLSYDLNSCSLKACTAIRLWLLDYYKSDFVTLNEIKLENGVEEEIVLTALMVLRVLYRMRQMLDFNFNQIFTKGWTHLHDFDEALDEKFETKCLKLMDLLCKHSIKKNLEIDRLIKQIDCLTNEKIILEQNIKLNDEKSLKSVAQQINFNKTIIKKVSNLNDENEMSLKSRNLSSSITTNSIPKLKKAPLSPTKTITKTAVKSANRKTYNSGISQTTISPTTPLSSTRHSPIRSNPPLPQQKQSTTNRRSMRLSNSSTAKLNANEMKSQKTICEIRAIFAETDDSEFEYFESSPSVQSSKAIALPLKKRKPTTTQPNEKTITTTSRKKNIQIPAQKSNKSHSWPSRKKNYPRKKRYPCDYPNCGYIADRPSTLVCYLN